MDFGKDQTKSEDSASQSVKMNNHMAKSVIAAILFTPAGVVPLVYSFLVDLRLDDGNFIAARRYSDKANNLSNAVIIIALCIIGLAIVLGLSSYLAGYSSVI
ncbi:MAG: CD225/dispanin family protein [Thermodesulfobacteriota bacterium]